MNMYIYIYIYIYIYMYIYILYYGNCKIVIKEPSLPLSKKVNVKTSGKMSFYL